MASSQGETIMLKTILKYGVIGGVVVGVPIFAVAVVMDGHPPLAWGIVFGYATMLIALSTVFLALTYGDASQVSPTKD